jgi:ABC-type multidrug transport system fused ATPase/permease subunit
VIKAAKAAQIHDFIETLAEGYDTIVGERGITLSGGQRQRVSIAQAIMTKPKILVFDDSVSAIDPKTESKIQDALQQTMEDRTTIIISQRPSSLQYVNKVFVLDNGRIIQSGTHDELMKSEGAYQDYINQVYANVKFMDWEISPEVEK